MLRTMSPPPGVSHVWNFSAFGSKRTIVFGLAKDSLYQSAPLVKTMPYGSDFGPLGDCHSVTLPMQHRAGRGSPVQNPRTRSYRRARWLTDAAAHPGPAAGIL